MNASLFYVLCEIEQIIDNSVNYSLSAKYAKKNGPLSAESRARREMISGYLGKYTKKVKWMEMHPDFVENVIWDPAMDAFVWLGGCVAGGVKSTIGKISQTAKKGISWSADKLSKSAEKITKSIEKVRDSDLLWPAGVDEKEKVCFGEDGNETYVGLSDSGIYIVIDLSAWRSSKRFFMEKFAMISYSDASPQVAIVHEGRKHWLHLTFGNDDIRHYRFGFAKKSVAKEWEQRILEKVYRGPKKHELTPIAEEQYSSLCEYLFENVKIGVECLDVFRGGFPFCEGCGEYIDYNEDSFCGMCGHPVAKERKEFALKLSDEGFVKFGLIKAGFFLLGEGDFDAADKFFDNALSIDVRTGEAYLGKYLVKEKIKKLSDLVEREKGFKKDPLYETAKGYFQTYTTEKINELEMEFSEKERWRRLNNKYHLLVDEINSFDKNGHEPKDKVDEQEWAQVWKEYRKRVELFTEIDSSADMLQLCDRRLEESQERENLLPKRSVARKIVNYFKKK